MPPYSDMFSNGEVILIFFHDKPTVFARVESITRERKRGWWQMNFLALTFPLKKMAWILDDDQVRGGEFTMRGHKIRIERVVAPPDEPYAEIKDGDDLTQDKEGGGRVISMFDDD